MSIVVAHEPSPFLSHVTGAYSAYMQRAAEQRRLDAERRASQQQAMADLFGNAIHAVMEDKKRQEEEASMWTYDWTPAQLAKMQEIDNNMQAIQADQGLDAFTKEQYLEMLDRQKSGMQKTKVPAPPKKPTANDLINGGQMTIDKDNGYATWVDQEGNVQWKTFAGTQANRTKMEVEILKERNDRRAEHIRRQEERYLDNLDPDVENPAPFQPDLVAAEAYARAVVPDPGPQVGGGQWQGMGADVGGVPQGPVLMPNALGGPPMPMQMPQAQMPADQMTPEQMEQTYRMMWAGGEDPLDWVPEPSAMGNMPAPVKENLAAEAMAELEKMQKGLIPKDNERIRKLLAIIEAAQ